MKYNKNFAKNIFDKCHNFEGKKLFFNNITINSTFVFKITEIL